MASFRKILAFKNIRGTVGRYCRRQDLGEVGERGIQLAAHCCSCNWKTAGYLSLNFVVWIGNKLQVSSLIGGSSVLNRTLVALSCGSSALVRTQFLTQSCVRVRSWFTRTRTNSLQFSWIQTFVSATSALTTNRTIVITGS